MSVYILPKLPTDNSELRDVLIEHNLRIHEPRLLRTIITNRDESFYLCSLSEPLLHTLVSHRNMLLPEDPTIITEAPGVTYPVAWLASANGLPKKSFTDLFDSASKDKQKSLSNTETKIPLSEELESDLESIDGGDL